MTLISYMILFMAAGIGGAAGTYWVRKAALRYGIVNHPNPLIPQHDRPVAYLGGIGIWLGAAFGIAAVSGVTLLVGDQTSSTFFIPTQRLWSAVGDLIFPATAFLVLGAIDDLRVLKAHHKFLWQTGIAALAVATGIRHDFTGQILVDFLASLFMMLVFVNAFNLTDVCDGLLGSLALTILTLWAFWHLETAPAAIAVAGACAGFLLFNAPPASIFLGDAGSHMLGFLTASLFLKAPADNLWPYLPQVALAVAVPLFELTFLVVIRMKKGVPWWRGSPDHFSLRLQAAGFSRLQTAGLACTLAAAAATSAYALQVLPGVQQGTLLSIVLVISAYCWTYLLKWEVRAASRDKTIPDAEEARG